MRPLWAKPINRRKRLDLREDTLSSLIWRLAIPTIFANLMVMTVFLADTIIVGWLKDEPALASVGLISVLMWMINSPFFALSVAANSLVSRFWGEEDFSQARKAAGQFLLITFLFTLIGFCLLFPTAEGVVRLLGARDTVVPVARDYLRVILLSTLAGQLMIVATGIMRGTGDTHTPMHLGFLMNSVNIIASVMLAFGIGPFPAMGIMGVGWGTVLGRSLGGVLGLALLAMESRGMGLRLHNYHNLEKAMLRRILRVAWPTMAENSLNSLGHLFFIRIIASLGAVAIGSHAIAVRVESLSFMPVLGIGAAIATVVGQAIGFKKHHIAEQAIKKGRLWALVFTCTLSTLFVIFAPQLVQLFGATEAVREMAALAVRVSALELPPLGLTIIFANALRGAGDTRSPMLAAISGIFIFRLGLAWLLALHLGWGLAGAWVATALDWAARAVTLWFLFRRGSWKTSHSREKERYRQDLEKTRAIRS